MALFICFIGEEDDLEAAEIRSLQLGFEIPRNFLNPDKYRPASIPDEAFAAVPDLITTAIFNVMDAQVPIDAFTPFLYLRNGRLEEFVVAYFMKLVSARVKSNMSRFFTAMHLIEMYREYVIIPPSHFLASHDTAAVGQDDGDDQDAHQAVAPKPQDDKAEAPKPQDHNAESVEKGKESGSVAQDEDKPSSSQAIN